MIKGLIIGALGMYIYLVQPEWADVILNNAKSVWNQIIISVQDLKV
jgi:hypothetical protein